MTKDVVCGRAPGDRGYGFRGQRCRTGTTSQQKGHLMADLALYHVAPSRSSVVLWMLEEVGEPYDIELLSMKKGANREPAYLAINPMGKVPALKHLGTIITECAAICTYL